MPTGESVGKSSTRTTSGPSGDARESQAFKAHATRRASRFVKGTTEPKPPNWEGTGIKAMLMHPLSVLLLCFPLGIISDLAGWGPVPTFFLNFTALVPLAKILGDATEELAAGLKNDMLAGLLNATFGNAVEMVIMVQTLRAGYLQVVKASLLGSVLSNLLLVLGMSFFFGGLVSSGKKPMLRISSARQSMPAGHHDAHMEVGSRESTANEVQGMKEETYTEVVSEKVQKFSVLTALVNTSMLLLSCLSFSLVTIFYSQNAEREEEAAVVPDGEEVPVVDTVAGLLPVSRTCSIIIIIAYCAYIFFQLVTHREVMGEEEGDAGDGEEVEEEEPALTISQSITVMLVCTFVVAFSSEFMVSSLEGVVEGVGVSAHFIGIILLPIVGNACEHASAIRFAIMDKPGLSIGIAVGSSTQISLFVVPFSVLFGWAIGVPMDLNFGNLNMTVMFISVIVVLSIVVDGTANWLQGYLLMSAYFVVAVLYWFLPNVKGEDF